MHPYGQVSDLHGFKKRRKHAIKKIDLLSDSDYCKIKVYPSLKIANCAIE